MQPPLKDSEILAEFFKSGNIGDGDDEVMDVSDGLEEKPIECTGKSDLLFASVVLQKFTLFSTKGEALQVDFLKIERNIDKHLQKIKSKLRLKMIKL